MNDAQIERAVGAYLGLAVGDALGATVEFMTPREILHTHGAHNEITGGGWLHLKPGAVTDDTTMSLALGEAIITANGIAPDAIAASFDRWMRDKPVDIGNTVRRGILHFRRTGEKVVPPSEHDAGNGACMRTLPIALATLGHSDEEVMAAVQAQAHISHNNPLSDAGTFCVVKMVQLALQGAMLGDLLQGPVNSLVSQHAEFSFRGRRREENPSGYIVHTLRAAFQAFFDTDTFEGCLVDVVNRGGDADTTGGIAGMMAGAFYGPEAIPERWLKRLDRVTAVSCREQAQELLKIR
jgi:ADP-ribosyl-[dinitrogen reductase] hydrolase